MCERARYGFLCVVHRGGKQVKAQCGWDGCRFTPVGLSVGETGFGMVGTEALFRNAAVLGAARTIHMQLSLPKAAIVSTRPCPPSKLSLCMEPQVITVAVRLDLEQAGNEVRDGAHATATFDGTFTDFAAKVAQLELAPLPSAAVLVLHAVLAGGPHSDLWSSVSASGGITVISDGALALCSLANSRCSDARWLTASADTTQEPRSGLQAVPSSATRAMAWARRNVAAILLVGTLTALCIMGQRRPGGPVLPAAATAPQCPVPVVKFPDVITVNIPGPQCSACAAARGW